MYLKLLATIISMDIAGFDNHGIINETQSEVMELDSSCIEVRSTMDVLYCLCEIYN